MQERKGLIIHLEQNIDTLEQKMHQIVIQEKDSNKMTQLAAKWRVAQELWLMTARGMSPEKAHAVMIGFTMNEITNWMNERRPGPPPSVLTLYPDGAISDEEFLR